MLIGTQLFCHGRIQIGAGGHGFVQGLCKFEGNLFDKAALTFVTPTRYRLEDEGHVPSIFSKTDATDGQELEFI